MLDFTSALYLGLRHASGSLRPWDQLTLGAPAALAEPPGARRTAARLARLIGCERAVLAPSTLHLYWDLFGMLSADGVTIYLDAGAYPIARWGVERAAARGSPVCTFPQHDVGALGVLLRQNGRHDRLPVVVTDGFSPGRGRAAPIPDYLDCIRPYGGQVVVDDTQALGIFGHSAGRQRPYGMGGGGSLRQGNINDPSVTVISSLAKGFGVPVAVMAGNAVTIARFESESETRVHCSPPSVATIYAAQHALDVNERHGTALRFRLARNVLRFRDRLAELGLAASGGLFPVQTLRLRPGQHVIGLHERLRGRGIETVLQRCSNGSGACISFLITARRRAQEIDQAVEVLASLLAMPSPKTE